MRNHICCFLGSFATFEQHLIISEENKVGRTQQEKIALKRFYSAVILINSIPFYKERKCTICPNMIYICLSSS